jgi:hypothetical protein
MPPLRADLAQSTAASKKSNQHPSLGLMLVDQDWSLADILVQLPSRDWGPRSREMPRPNRSRDDRDLDAGLQAAKRLEEAIGSARACGEPLIRRFIESQAKALNLGEDLRGQLGHSGSRLTYVAKRREPRRAMCHRCPSHRRAPHHVSVEFRARSAETCRTLQIA